MSRKKLADMMNVGERIKQLRKTLGLSQKDLSNMLNIHLQTLSRYERGELIPSIEILQKLTETLNVNPLWFLTGESSIFLDPPEKVSIKKVKDADDNIISCKEADFFLVPKVKARLTAGTGTLETSSEVIGRFAFRLDWLHTITTSPRSLVLMEVYGDSMEPEIKDGDTVMVDQSQKEIIIGKIYAVGFGEEIVIKQVYKEPDKLILKSINKEYEPIKLPADEWQDRIRIIGRVVWWCREG